MKPRSLEAGNSPEMRKGTQDSCWFTPLGGGFQVTVAARDMRKRRGLESLRKDAFPSSLATIRWHERRMDT